MQLLTKAQEKLLRKQYQFGSDLAKQKVVVKIFNPQGSWAWYLLNQDPDDPNYLWAIVKGFEVEIGSVSLKELQEFRSKNGLTLPLERDLSFTPRPAQEVWNRLLEGKHV